MGNIAILRINYKSDFVLTLNSDGVFKGNRRAIIDVVPGTSSQKILTDIAASNIDVVSYREMIPSMNNIFIKLVKGEDK